MDPTPRQFAEELGSLQHVSNVAMACFFTEQPVKDRRRAEQSLSGT